MNERRLKSSEYFIPEDYDIEKDVADIIEESSLTKEKNRKRLYSAIQKFPELTEYLKELSTRKVLNDILKSCNDFNIKEFLIYQFDLDKHFDDSNNIVYFDAIQEYLKNYRTIETLISKYDTFLDDPDQLIEDIYLYNEITDEFINEPQYKTEERFEAYINLLTRHFLDYECEFYDYEDSELYVWKDWEKHIKNLRKYIKDNAITLIDSNKIFDHIINKISGVSEYTKKIILNEIKKYAKDYVRNTENYTEEETEFTELPEFPTVDELEDINEFRMPKI